MSRLQTCVFSRMIVVVTLITLSVHLSGCTVHKSVTVRPEEVTSGVAEKIVAVIYLDGSEVKFNKAGGRYSTRDQRIRGTTEAGDEVAIAIVELSSVRVERVDQGLTGVATLVAVFGVALLIVAVLALIIAATKESCPFIYSWDGEQYVFDAEPLGGAVCRALAKTDVSRLEHLQAVDGEYKLMIRNEVEEIQYIDRMRLLVVDHSPDEEIVPDYEGNLKAVRKLVSPATASDETGRDISRFFEARDQVVWQSNLPLDNASQHELSDQDLRHNLTFEFPKPEDVATANLVVNVGTALWGSNMIREMLQLRGDRVDDWYRGMNTGGPEVLELAHFVEREQLYILRVEVLEGESWVRRGYLAGNGPLITEDRIVPIDLSGVVGDTVRMRLTPPMGFWTMDYLALEYESYETPPATVVPVSRAVDQKGDDIHDHLINKDDQPYTMPEVGDWAELVFEAPPQNPGTKRSLFLDTYGYYEIQIDETQPEKTDLIAELLATDGMILQYSMDEYFRWRASYARSDR